MSSSSHKNECSLYEFIVEQKNLEIDVFLQIALNITQIVGELHKSDIIYKYINSHNILIDKNTKEVKLLDIKDISTKRQENLLYMSPEQTGRMGKKIDFRTDFYSLGVTFYEMLTGRLPLQGESEIELTYSHIAKEPLCPNIVNEKIPYIISGIVMKLLSKDPEDRYKNSFGLRNDLLKCMIELKEKGIIEEFELGEKDVNDKFDFSDKLYGREKELKRILSSYDNVKQGKGEVVLISGDAGIGKSTLMKEVKRNIIENGGIFVSGKCMQYDNSTPYSPIIQVATKLVKHILVKSEEEISKIREETLEIIGNKGKIIIDFIPELEYIIGNHIESLEYESLELENSFNDVLLRMIDMFLQKDYPVVFFIDDLQWIDSASLKFLKSSIKYMKKNNALLIYAFRESEDIYKNYPVINLSKDLEKNDYKITYINIKPLGIREVNDLICDALNCDRYSSMLLAKLITYKTGGNPFFVKIFLENMFNEHILEFDYEKGEWKWDINKILKIKLDENSLDLLTKKIKTLPKYTIELLKLASCIGIEFDLKILSSCNDKAIHQNTIDILPAIRMGIVSPVSKELNGLSKNDTIVHINEFINKYMFCHDHIHEQFYSTIDEDEKRKFHFNIGNVLLDKFKCTQTEVNVFDIVNQLNKAQELMIKEEKIYELVKLNLDAGKKAYASGAYNLALKYLKIGYDLLQENSWEINYDLTYEVYLTFAQYQCLNGDLKKGEETFNIILNNAKSRKDKAKIYDAKINLYSFCGKYKQAIENGIFALKLYNINIPIHPSKTQVKFQFLKIKIKNGHKEEKVFNKKSLLKDEEKIQVKRIFMNMKFPAMIFDKKLFELITLKQMQIVLKYGACENDVRACVDYALCINLLCDDYNRAYNFGIKALNKYESSLNVEFYKSEVYFSSLISPWIDGIDASVDCMKRDYVNLLDSGEIIYAIYTLNSLIGFSFFKGQSLLELYTKCKKHMKVIGNTKLNYMEHGVILITKVLGTLLGKEEENILIEDNKDIKDIELNNINRGTRTLGYYTYKLFLSYIYGDLQLGKKFIELCEKEQRFYKGSFIEALGCIYSTLLMTELYSESNKNDKKVYLEKIGKNLQKVKKWSVYCPKDYESYYLLIEGKLKIISGYYKRAEEILYKSMRSVVKNGSLLNAAVVCERFGDFYSEMNENQLAEIYLVKAYKFYEQWGAVKKLQYLKEKYPKIFFEYYEDKNKDKIALANNKLNEIACTCTNTEIDNEKIDLISIVKASQAISKEIVLENLLEKLMKILIQNAGAQRGCLILKRDKEFKIEVEGDANKINSLISKHISIDKYNEIPKLVINYVLRTKKSIVLKDASKENMFVHDSYIYSNNIKSMLCSPIMNKGKLIGIIYLENNFTTDVFSKQRLNIVNLLSSQAAISIENAYMYKTIKEFNEQLEKKVEERTKSLNETMRYEELRTEFFANISHELRTPLNVIFGGQQMLEVLIRNNMPMNNSDKIGKYMVTMKQNCYRLVRLINNLIDITKIDAGYFQVILKNRNIVDIVESITLSVAEYIENNGINLIFDTDVEEKVIACDPDKIERIMLNLLSNSLKFTEKGGNILVNMFDKGDKIIISVKDDGIGIPEDKQKTIFDRFIQVDKSLSRNREGSGIGLSIVKSLVEMHGGSINIISEQGQGTEFVIEIPNIQVEENEEEIAKESYFDSNKVERIEIEFSDIYSN